MKYLFDKSWFKEHQKKLLWLLNSRLTKKWFRWVLRIRKEDCLINIKITGIAPNSFSFGDRYFKKKGKWYLERTTDFRTHNKYSKRLFYAFYPLWYFCHCWDILIANNFAPQLNLGFDTLTVYPDPHTETSTVDGFVCRSGETINDTWANTRNGAGITANDTGTSEILAGLRSSETANKWYDIWRGILLFNITTLPANATIISNVFGVCSSYKADELNIIPKIAIVSSAPASNVALAPADYNIANFGTTRFATDMAYADYKTNVTYNLFDLNSDFLTFIQTAQAGDKIVKLGVRTDYDLDDATPTWASYAYSFFFAYFADQAGTSIDPKLVITYSTPVGGKFFQMF